MSTPRPRTIFSQRPIPTPTHRPRAHRTTARPERRAPAATASPTPRLSASTCPPSSCRSASRRRCTPTRTGFGLLYRLLWRLVHEPGLRQRHARRGPDARRGDGARDPARHPQDDGVRALPADPESRGWRRADACRLVRARAPHRRGGGALFHAPLHGDAVGDPHARAQRALGRARTRLRDRAPRSRRHRPPTRPSSSGSPITEASSTRPASS